MAQQRAQVGLAAARPHGLSERRKPKVTPELVDKAQQMYDSRRYHGLESPNPGPSAQR